MSVQPAPATGQALERLFTPGPRLGWIFRDPREMIAPFRDKAPDQEQTRLAANQSDLALVLGFWWAGQLKQDRKGGSAMRNAGWS